MDIYVKANNFQASNADTLILGVFQEANLSSEIENINIALGRAITELVEAGDFNAKTGQVAVVFPRGAIIAKRVLLVGLGKKDELNLEIIRRAAAYGLKKANSSQANHVAITLLGQDADKFDAETIAQAIIEGSSLALYQYQGQKTKKNSTEANIEQLEILVNESELNTAQSGVNAGKAISAGVYVTRDLVNLPPNYCTPAYMANIAEQVAAEVGLKVEILEKSQMEALKMGALLAVAQGSDSPPRFIILEHNAHRANELDTLVLVGKGVTFDTGGYSIKTQDGMVTMKGDMAGGGAVIGAMKAIALLDLPYHVVGLIPSADNLISGAAYKPQDVITASNGLTIEIISTDAEGRLLLADALVYAARYKPAAVVDIATLTGACMVALGGQAAGLFSTNEALQNKLIAAGATTQERVWPLPLFSEYKKSIESNTADLKNSGGRWGGASVAAAFLQYFVDYPAWAHVDMAGIDGGDGENPYLPKGATGYGVRLFTEFVRRWGEA